MPQVTWKRGIAFVNSILRNSDLHSFSTFGPKGHKAQKGNSASHCRCLCLSHRFPACVAFKGWGVGWGVGSSSASQRNDHCSEVGWQVSLQINILWLHMYDLESQVLTL